MNRQLQLQLEEPAPRKLGGGPPGVQAAWLRGFSEPVLAEIEARLNERPGEWLGWADFADIRERHNIGCCMGHVKFHLAQTGRAIRKNIYYGSERPGDPDYKGYNTVYGSTLCGPAPERKRK